MVASFVRQCCCYIAADQSDTEEIAMLTQIRGLHHVTSLASGARDNNVFFTQGLGLRRVKKTVNFDAPDVYHLYYGDGTGTPGTVMTYFPFPRAARGRRGAGEVSVTAFSVPPESLPAWEERLATFGVTGIARDERLGAARVLFDGPDGERFALTGVEGDGRLPWTGGGIGADMAIRGFHGVELRLADPGATIDLLRFMGYEEREREGGLLRMGVAQGNGADLIDIVTTPGLAAATQGAGSVHHIAFAVGDRARQREVREALKDAGWQVTPPIDRDYFWAIYFRSPGGVLFEVATDEPGFARDEPREAIGRTLRLPAQHEHLRARLERQLEPIGD
jgi:glyoxalase family protein